MYRFGLLLILLLTGVSSWAQPILPTTPYTYRFMTNRTALEARTYLGISATQYGASNALASINNMTNAAQILTLRTNAASVPTLNTNHSGATATTFFDFPYAAAAVSGILNSNDFKAFVAGGAGSFGETSLSTLVGNQTLFNSANAIRTLTFGLSGAEDPTLTASDGLLEVAGSVGVSGALYAGGEMTALGDLVVNGSLFFGAASSQLAANTLTTNTIQKVVYVPVGGGAITNIVWESNAKYLIGVGTNTVSTFNSDTDGHIDLNAKTNITIEGMGPQSVLYSPNPGTLMLLENCRGIHLKNLTLEGTRVANGATLSRGYGISAVIMKNSRFCTFENVTFQNHPIHGISDNESLSTNASFLNCIFRLIGSTNFNDGGITSDGSGIVIPGSNCRVAGCLFDTLYNGIEVWPSRTFGAEPAEISNVRIEDNMIIGPWGNGVYAQNSLVNVMNASEGLKITGNLIEYNPSTYWGGQGHAAILIKWGKKGLIANNIIRRAPVGIQLTTAGGVTMNSWLIINNNIGTTGLPTSGAGHGVVLDTFSGVALDQVSLIGNHLVNVANVGVAANKIRFSSFVDNVFRNVTTNYGGLPAMWLLLGCESNSIVGNGFYFDGAAGIERSAYAIRVDAAADKYNQVTGNKIHEFTTAPWLDAGVGTSFRDNWIGTNFQTGGITHIAEATIPGTPPANSIAFYVKDSAGVSRLFYKGDNGTEYGPLDAGGGAGTPGGATTQIQYNNASAFDGASGIVIPASEGETNLNVTGVVRVGGGIASSNNFTLLGGGTTRFRMEGSTLGFVEFQPPASGQSNSIILDIANTAPGGVLKIFSNTPQAGTNLLTVTNIGIAPFTNSYVGAVVFVPSDALAKEVQVLVATNDFQLNWTNQVPGKLISLSIYNNGATNIGITHHAGVRFMGGASNIVAAGRELAVAAKFIGTNISLAFAPQTN